MSASAPQRPLPAPAHLWPAGERGRRRPWRRIRRPRLRSLKNKIALLFGAITALAFGVIFFYVVPQLQSSLEGQTVRDLRRAAEASSPRLESVIDSDVPAAELDELVRAAADSAEAQLTVLGLQDSGQGRIVLFPISDSRAGTAPGETYAVAQRAAKMNALQTGVRTAGGQRVAQVAEPLLLDGRPAWVALYSRSLEDTTNTVSLIRAQVLAAGGIALLVALLGGYLIARALARRVRRLELAAREVAAGHFIEPLPIDSQDELGELTRTFNDMKEQLARLDRARREFIANASHELRTPIFSLAGFAELLEDEELDEETRREFLHAMREQTERLRKLAVDLLDLSRLDAGALQIHPEETDLGELARTVTGEFRPAAARHGRGLDLRLPDDTVEAWCDRERVAQIMRILLDNALRHTPEGTPVTVTAEGDNGTAAFAVADAGPGVDPASREQLFERFYTADAARGSGLGLAIAKELAERMGGRISLSSTRGETVFTLALPAQRSGGSSS